MPIQDEMTLQEPHSVNAPQKSSHKNLPMRVLSRISPSYIPPTSPNAPRAVYIFLRPCIQTFNSRCTRYLNLPLRLIQNRTRVSHWGLLLSSELPSWETQPGDFHTLSSPWEQTSCPLEFDVPELDEAAKTVNVGSFEHKYPTVLQLQKKFVYLGLTFYDDSRNYEEGGDGGGVFEARGGVSWPLQELSALY